METEAARSRFEPRNRLSCDVKVLFIYFFFFCSLHRQVNVWFVYSAFPALGSPLSKPFLYVCGDRITELIPGGQQSN